jgi:hypothetical protein
MIQYISLLIVIAILLIWVWMLVDCITNKRLKGRILRGFGHRKHPWYVIICRQMKLIPLTSTAYIFWVQPEHRATVERYLLAAG